MFFIYFAFSFIYQNIYYSSEVNDHAALKHDLMRRKHECHPFCLPKMKYDLRQILSIKVKGWLKHLYFLCLKYLEKVYNNFNDVVLNVLLEDLLYLHSNECDHQGVKGMYMDCVVCSIPYNLKFLHWSDYAVQFREIRGLLAKLSPIMSLSGWQYTKLLIYTSFS